MIYKELDPFQSDDKFARAGRAAEETMAFYLKRYFANDANALVLNGIRLEADGDAAQIDHLVIHPYGLTIVESKSVHGKVQIKDDGQWIRWFGANQSKGMASPLTQARLQERFFREVLGKASQQKELFNTLPIDLFVAISDSGVILWPSTGAVAGVCKADQVAERIIDSMRAKELAWGTGTVPLAAINRERIAAFLVAANKPLRPAVALAVTEEIVAAKVPATSALPKLVHGVHHCKHCASEQLEIRYGFTYFFFCLACGKNSPIKATCPKCNEPARLRKLKKEFFLECEKDRYSSLYFANP